MNKATGKKNNVNQPPTVQQFIEEPSIDKFRKNASSSVGMSRSQKIFDCFEFLIHRESINQAFQKLALN